MSERRSIEVTADTVDEAIQQGLSELGVQPWDVMVEVMDEPLGYSVTETQRRLGNISRNSVYRAVNRQDLELVKIGTRSIITARSVNALLNRSAELKAVV